MPALYTCTVPCSTVKLTALVSPICNSFEYWFRRPKICGTNAAMVSVFSPGGMLLATSNPSCNAMSAPATLGNCVVRWTISLGVQVFLSGSPKSSERLAGAFLGAGAGVGVASAAGAALGAGATSAAAVPDGAGATFGGMGTAAEGTAPGAGSASAGAGGGGSGLP